jgi:hypothetical protein
MHQLYFVDLSFWDYVADEEKRMYRVGHHFVFHPRSGSPAGAAAYV